MVELLETLPVDVKHSFVICIVNIMAADDQAPCVVRPPEAMSLIFSEYSSSAQRGLIRVIIPQKNE